MPSHQPSSRTQSKSRNILSESTEKITTSKTKKTSSYDPNFEQNLINNDIYSDDYDFLNDRDSSRLNNENEILSRLGQPRSSLSSSQFFNKKFRIFKKISVIQNTVRISFAKNLVFKNLESLIHDNLIDVKSDFYDEARSAQIDLRIREELESYITSITQRQTPALFNFFTEAKSPDESAIVTKRQAYFDEALSARDVHKLRSFKANLTLAYNNSAYIIIFTYNDGTLKMYTIHLT